MKTSNKLIIALILVSMIAMLGTNLEIKAAYNKIKPDDLFYGYETKPVKAFKTVVLIGNDHGFIEIQQGKSNEVRINKDLADRVKQTISGDTLKISYLEKERNKYPTADLTWARWPAVYIEAQQLSSVSIKDIPCKIRSWHSDHLDLSSTSSFTLLDDNSIKNVTASYQKGSGLQINKNNVLGNTTIKIKDSSSLNIQQDVFTSLDLDLETTAKANLSGDLLRKLMKK
ncbi:hypothetical protein [Dyadobacter sp. LHD-138]|uniref:hypothetical protein n=1 Tax=Dyadobacter sp. LHD-138 TaxID=3071413 RepID=UPI0027E05F69|nr:hypothetical protein [Dyadobacter sp. LHD-138]MDQ6476779.1 hypothetical protein [Dyadobacter sp. LHD-138]